MVYSVNVQHHTFEASSLKGPRLQRIKRSELVSVCSQYSIPFSPHYPVIWRYIYIFVNSIASHERNNNLDDPILNVLHIHTGVRPLHWRLSVSLKCANWTSLEHAEFSEKSPAIPWLFTSVSTLSMKLSHFLLSYQHTLRRNIRTMKVYKLTSWEWST